MLKKLALPLAFCATCLAQEIPVPNIEFNPKKYICYTSGEALNIDGKLDEKAWTKAVWTDNFADIEGAIKPVPRFRTRAKMLWDKDYLYIAAELEEPDIFGTVKNRDEIIFLDNDFEIFIDPDGNTHRYSEFEMNALNTVWDLLLVLPYRDTQNAAVTGWDIKGLKTGVSVHGTIDKSGDKDSLWTVEVAFPWKAFKEISETPAPPKDKDQWRINFSRVEWKTEVKDGVYKKQINPATGNPFPEDNWVWSPQGVVNMHYPEMWGYVQFSDKTAGEGNDSFVVKKEESAKWYLRQIYYLERFYFEKNKSFTTDLKKIGFKEMQLPGYITPASVECTESMFEASVMSEDGSEKVSIRSDGLTWITRTNK